MNPADSYKEIIESLDAHQEWLLIEPAAKSFALRRSEIELLFEREKLLLSFLCSGGFQTWRVTDWKFENQKLNFNLTRNFNRERIKIELVPRILSGELAQSVERARIEKANKIADLVVANQPKAKLVRVSLNKETGRFAQIIFESMPGKQIAALSDVSGAATPERLLTFAILWLVKLSNRKKNPVNEIWILAEGKSAKDLAKLRALLKINWQPGIKVFEISGHTEKSPNELKLVNREIKFADLWREKPKKITPVRIAEISETARKIIELAPAEIDAVFTRHGETLRFLGLPFGRVRTTFGQEKAWFGIEAKRRALNEKSFEEFLDLVENLKNYRRFNAENKRHEFYRLAPESWLESLLRRNIRQLDANLILSPIHNQFRISGDQIDLLALRKDGRLVIIELKTSADREMIFQAADYWRKVELQRRAGNLLKAKIFGDAVISDQPALVYLVAPMLSFHRNFRFLAQTILPEIEIARFDLNENWRRNLKVLERKMI